MMNLYLITEIPKIEIKKDDFTKFENFRKRKKSKSIELTSQFNNSKNIKNFK
jgi:hypothetical protein